jgi:glycerol-3-phosphate dehydrogenase
MRALQLAEFTQNLPGGSERLPGRDPILLGEVHFAYDREWAKTPEDFYRRRTDIYFTRNAGMESFPRVQAFFLAKHPLLGSNLGQDADYEKFLKRNRHRAGGIT